MKLEVKLEPRHSQTHGQIRYLQKLPEKLKRITYFTGADSREDRMRRFSETPENFNSFPAIIWALVVQAESSSVCFLYLDGISFDLCPTSLCVCVNVCGIED